MSDHLLIRAARGEPVERTPVWIMRQAGRYLPEYQAVRSKMSFLELCHTPEKAAEVSIQPLDILGVDGVIVFSDILVPLEGMGPCYLEITTNNFLSCMIANQTQQPKNNRKELEDT